VETCESWKNNRLEISIALIYYSVDRSVKFFHNWLDMANPETIDLKTLGENIRLARTGKGWSLTALAEASGISKSYISDLENGVAGRPNIQYVFSLARAMDTTLDRLIEGTTPSDKVERRGMTVPTELPPGLAELKQEMHLSDDDVERIATMHFRGNRPRDKEGWRYLLNTLNMLGQRPPEREE
jgi:transcriptional regulator with XRE-family HTH domain